MHGAQPDARNKKNETPEELALENKHFKIVDYRNKLKNQ